MSLYKIKIETEVKKPFFKKIDNETFSVGLREKRERNLANLALMKILKEKFPNKRLKIISGLRSSSKILEVLSI